MAEGAKCATQRKVCCAVARESKTFHGSPAGAPKRHFCNIDFVMKRRPAILLFRRLPAWSSPWRWMLVRDLGVRARPKIVSKMLGR